MCDLVSHSRPGHVPVPHHRSRGVVGRAVPLSPPIRLPVPDGKKAPGDTWLRGALRQAAVNASRTANRLGERYGPIARRPGKAKAQVTVALSILVIIWHLLADPAALASFVNSGFWLTFRDGFGKSRSGLAVLMAGPMVAVGGTHGTSRCASRGLRGLPGGS